MRNQVRDIVQVNDSIYAFAGDYLHLIELQHRHHHQCRYSYNQWPAGPVSTMQTDDQQNVWLSTANGMYKYNFRSNHFIRFTQWDGLITVYNQHFLMESSAEAEERKDWCLPASQNMVEL